MLSNYDDIQHNVRRRGGVIGGDARLLTKQSYEDLYYGVASENPEVSTCFKRSIQEAFAKRNIVRNAVSSMDGIYRELMLTSLSQVFGEIQGQSVTLSQSTVLSQDFDYFVACHEDSYNVFFDNFEKEYGEPVDFITRHDRSFLITDTPEKSVDEQLSMFGVFEDGVTTISYSEKVVNQLTPVRQRYTSVEQTFVDDGVEDLKREGGFYNREYDAGCVIHNTASHFTVADSYGFDELDDGPEL